MVITNLSIFINKYCSLNKIKRIKNSRLIKVNNRSMKLNVHLKNYFLAIYNGHYYLPIKVDNNKINYVSGLFSFSFNIRLKKVEKKYKKRKK
jgi:ribosomal protein S19